MIGASGVWSMGVGRRALFCKWVRLLLVFGRLLFLKGDVGLSQ